MKLLVEASALAQSNKTGVGYFSTHLIEGLEAHAKASNLHVEYLWLNFLGRKTPSSELLVAAKKGGRLREVRWIPQRVYVKLLSFGVSLPLTFRRYDLTLFPNFYLWNIPRARKNIVVVHDLCYARHPEFIEQKNLRFLRRVMARTVKRADLVVGVSEFTRDELIDYYHLPPERVLALDIPVNNQRLPLNPPAGTLQKARETFGLSKGYILTVGAVEPRKNLLQLVKAYRLLPQELREKYSLVLAGPSAWTTGYGWKTEELKELINASIAEGYDIISTGYIPAELLPALFKQASLFAIPSHYEGFGMPALEAMHYGLPVIANDVPVLREVGAGACVYVDANDEQAFAAEVERLLRDKKFSAQLGVAAQKRAQTYTWEKTINKFLKGIKLL